MTVKYPAWDVALDQHTVADGPKRVAGFLVRDTRSRAELGFVWQRFTVHGAPVEWQWATMTAQHFGARATQREAVRVLVEIATLEARPPTSSVLRDNAARRPSLLGPLRDAAARAAGCAQQSRRPLLDLHDDDEDAADLDAEIDARTTARPSVTRMPPAPPAPRVRQIVWGTQAGSADALTSALGAALRRKREESGQ